MKDHTANTKQTFLKCKICYKEIPKSSALTAEGLDYVWNFCGKDCYNKWFSEKDKTEK